MAPSAPREVASVFLAIETEDYDASVWTDMLTAALAMPVGVGKELVPGLCKVITHGGIWLDFDDACDFCIHLAAEGEADAAMNLAGALFTPRFARYEETPRGRDEHFYKEGLKKAIPALVAVRAVSLLPKLCDWLCAAIEAKKYVDRKSGQDFSYSWRPAVEEHEGNKTYDFAGEMVGFIRGAFEQAIDGGFITLVLALKVLDHYSYLVFQRLRIHLINRYAELDPALARETMLRREYFDDYQFKHEYAMLAGKRLPVLEPRERERWFSWIDAQPSDEQLGIEESATGGQRAKRTRYWRFERLHWVRATWTGRGRQSIGRCSQNMGSRNLLG